jgi:hypothetical protein
MGLSVTIARTRTGHLQQPERQRRAEHGIAYRARAPRRRRLHSSLRAGKPSTGRREPVNRMNRRGGACDAQSRHGRPRSEWFTGEPDALKGASPVRGEAVGNLLTVESARRETPRRPARRWLPTLLGVVEGHQSRRNKGSSLRHVDLQSAEFNSPNRRKTEMLARLHRIEVKTLVRTP